MNKRFKISEQLLFGLLMLLGIVFLFTPQSSTNKLQFAFARVFHRPLSVWRIFSSGGGNEHYSEDVDVVARAKYIRLRNHLANNMEWLRQERQNVAKLAGLRNRGIWEGANFVLADVIVSFMDGNRNEFTINRGRSDGLSEGQFVLGDRSIIGTITELDQRTARVQLVTDIKSRIPVKIGGLELQAVMQGIGNGSARIELLSIKHKVDIGSIVYAKKKPLFLDSAVITGKIVRCKPDNENPLLWDIVVKPSCNIQKLDSVAVVVMIKDEQGKVCSL